MRSIVFSPGARAPRASQQRGVVMWVALIVLIVMTLAGLATMRQMSTGVSIAGNIAFKESATAVADIGTEDARLYILDNLVDLNVDAIPGFGYHATWGASVDPTTYDWDNESKTMPAVVANTSTTGTGNTARYMIHRLCQNTGPVVAPAQRCSDHENPTGGSKSGKDYRPGPLEPPNLQAYFRVTVRVDGPRNTVSYTQVVMK